MILRWTRAHGAAIALVVGASVIGRGVLLVGYPGNKDVLLFISNIVNRSHGIHLAGGYDFTLALGTRTLSRATWLNPFSVAQYVGGAGEGVWLRSSVFVVALVVAFQSVSKKLGHDSASGILAALFTSISIVIPSTFRVGNLIDFGGVNFMVVAIGNLLFIGALLRFAGSWRTHVHMQVVLLWWLTASLHAQPFVIWNISLIVLAFVGVFLWEQAPGNAIQLVKVATASSAVALIVSTLLFASPSLAILASGNSRSGSERGIELAHPELALWLVLGNSNLIRLIVTVTVVAALWWQLSRMSAVSARLARLAICLGVLLIGYSVVYALMASHFQLEIGPRPFYMVQLIILPIGWLVVAVSLLERVTSLVRRLIARTRLLRVIPAGRVSGSLIVKVLVLLWLLAWSARNPNVAVSAMNPKAEIQVSPRLADSYLENLLSARVLFVSDGESFGKTSYFPSNFFNFEADRARSDAVIVYLHHAHEITRWQHWLFEEFGASRGRNVPIFLWSRQFNADLAAFLNVTHVVSEKPIRNPSLTGRFISIGDSAGYLYRFEGHSRVWTGSDAVIVREEDNVKSATRLALQGAAASRKIVVRMFVGEISIPEAEDFRIQRERVLLNLKSPLQSLLVLPIEFSACHRLEVNGGSAISVKLLPVNGRLLGVLYAGDFSGQITFKSRGPVALRCQIVDYLQTRLIN